MGVEVAKQADLRATVNQFFGHVESESEDRGGDVYVSDWRNDRVQRFDGTGHPLDIVGSVTLLRLAGLAVAADATLYVADWGHGVVQAFDVDHRLVDTLAGDATLSQSARAHPETFPSVAAMRDKADRAHEERLFRRPSGIATRPDGHRVGG